jgi:hypothetical protein
LYHQFPHYITLEPPALGSLDPTQAQHPLVYIPHEQRTRLDQSPQVRLGFVSDVPWIAPFIPQFLEIARLEARYLLDGFGEDLRADTEFAREIGG